MRLSLVPDYSFGHITDLEPEFLKRRGVRLLMLDLDNTIAPYDMPLPADEIARWAGQMRESGIEIVIVTNNRKAERVGKVASALGVVFFKGANKPLSAGIKKALEMFGLRPEEAALAGDQIFTDVLAANIAGVISIVVRPLRLKGPLLGLRYLAEAPFRAMCRNRNC